MNNKKTYTKSQNQQTNNGAYTMQNIFKSNMLINFSADVFMCEEHKTASNLRYWKLRLLTQGKLIDAFHWQPVNRSIMRYNEKDSVLVAGKWTSVRKERFQVIRSAIVSSYAANDDDFCSTKLHQLELDFGDDININQEG